MDAGVWDGVYKISNNYINLATLSFSYYFLPSFSKICKNKEIRNEIRNALITMIPILIIGGSITYLLRDYLIQFLLSGNFKQASLIIKWQVLGDGFNVLCWILGMLLISKEKVAAFITSELLSGGIFITCAYILIPKLGLEGSTLSYFIENIISFTLLYVVFIFYWKNDN